MSTPRSLITSTPHHDPCPRCGRLVLTGHAEGLTYKVDPAPVTVHAELAARQAGRTSYALIADTLAARTPSRIRGDTTRSRGRPPVLISHHCEAPPEPAGVDVAYVAAVTGYLDRARRREARDLATPVSDTEFDALALFGCELGASLIDPSDPPPF